MSDHRRVFVITPQGELGPFTVEDLHTEVREGRIQRSDRLRTAFGANMGNVGDVVPAPRDRPRSDRRPSIRRRRAAVPLITPKQLALGLTISILGIGLWLIIAEGRPATVENFHRPPPPRPVATMAAQPVPPSPPPPAQPMPTPIRQTTTGILRPEIMVQAQPVVAVPEIAKPLPIAVPVAVEPSPPPISTSDEPAKTSEESVKPAEEPSEASDQPKTPGRSLPYTGQPHLIPGSIQGWQFDLGDDGIAYHDSDDRNTGAFDGRPGTGVDLGVQAETDQTIVRFIADGEWLNFSCMIVNPGTYKWTIMAARKCPPEQKMYVQWACDGTPVGKPMEITNTSSWDDFKPTTGEIALPAGRHILRLTFRGYHLDFTSLSFEGPPGDP